MSCMALVVCRSVCLSVSPSGSIKAVSLGGFGVWWVIDIIRVGSTPVYANKYVGQHKDTSTDLAEPGHAPHRLSLSACFPSSSFRTAADLPHWAFVLSSVSTTFILGKASALHSPPPPNQAFLPPAGFILVGCSTLRYIRVRRKDAFLLAAEIEAAHHAEYPPYSSTVAAPFVSKGHS